jgi:hypothetical protein
LVVNSGSLNLARLFEGLARVLSALSAVKSKFREGLFIFYFF